MPIRQPLDVVQSMLTSHAIASCALECLSLMQTRSVLIFESYEVLDSMHGDLASVCDDFSSALTEFAGGDDHVMFNRWSTIRQRFRL